VLEKIRVLKKNRAGLFRTGGDEDRRIEEKKGSPKSSEKRPISEGGEIADQANASGGTDTTEKNRLHADRRGKRGKK